MFWDCIHKEIILGKVKTEKTKLKKKIPSEISVGLLAVLYSSLSLCNQYKEMFIALKDSLGGNQNLQYAPIFTNLMSKKCRSDAKSDITLAEIESSSSVKINRSPSMSYFNRRNFRERNFHEFRQFWPFSRKFVSRKF